MKKALAVLVIMMVALTSVFAADSTITLTNTIADEVTWELQYKIVNEGNNTDFAAFTTESKTVDLTKDGRLEIEILLKGNTSKAISKTYAFDVKGFNLVDGEATVTENAVPASFSIGKNNEIANPLWTVENTTENNGVTVSLDKHKRMASKEVVAKGTMSWTGDTELVAGSYVATIGVTITPNN